MSLWTPDGEHRVPREPSPRPGANPTSDDRYFDDPALSDLSPEQRAQAEELAEQMAEVRRQMLSVPAEVVVANHAMGLYELAAIHLGVNPPNLTDAKLAIDAFSALIDQIGDRLGEDSATLREALKQIQLGYVQIKAGFEDQSAEAESPST